MKARPDKEFRAEQLMRLYSAADDDIYTRKEAVAKNYAEEVDYIANLVGEEYHGAILRDVRSVHRVPIDSIGQETVRIGLLGKYEPINENRFGDIFNVELQRAETEEIMAETGKPSMSVQKRFKNLHEMDGLPEMYRVETSNVQKQLFSA